MINIRFSFVGNTNTREFRSGTDMYKYATENQEEGTYYIETEHVRVSYTREEILNCWRIR